MPFRQRLNTRKKVRLSVLITVLLWFSLLSLFFFTNPDTNLLVVVFFVNFFLVLGLVKYMEKVDPGAFLSKALFLLLLLQEARMNHSPLDKEH